MPQPSFDSPLRAWFGWSLHATCRCGTVPVAVARLVARHGPDTPLLDVCDRLRCDDCRERPRTMTMRDAAAELVGIGA